jgi:hypothetical protein
MSFAQVLLIFMLIALTAFAALAIGVVLIARAVARAARRRTAAFANRTSRQLQSWVPGPTRPINGARLALQRDVMAATEAVGAGRKAARPVAQLRGPARVLRQAAADLDLDLAVIAGEPDSGARTALFDAQRERIETVHRVCRQLRNGVLLAAGDAGGVRVSVLSAELNDELELLRFRAIAYRDLMQH